MEITYTNIDENTLEIRTTKPSEPIIETVKKEDLLNQRDRIDEMMVSYSQRRNELDELLSHFDN